MDAPVKAGDIIDGRYQLERIIGTGGMAVVVAAIDIERSERVALKFLFKKAARHKEILQRFEREQAVISRLEGEHIARMLGSGVIKNTPYMVMEYLQGRDLMELLRVQKKLSVEQATDYILQACEAVAEAHGLEIVHRDLKPGNLFLTHRMDGSPCIKVLDFGIAKILGGGDGEGSLTRTEVVMGSPHYMSPEQMISAKDVGPATDIWALGVILHELLTGKLPFAEKTTEKLCSRVLKGEPTPLREECRTCPEGLEQIVLRCLRRMPEDRYTDIGDFAEALSEFAPFPPHVLVSRVRHLLKHPGEPPPEHDEAPRLSHARDPEEALESPTVYLPRKSRIPWRHLILVAFGGGMLALGFAGGVLFRDQGVPAADQPEMAVTSSYVFPPVAKPTEDPEDLEDLEDLVPELPIEIDLDDMKPEATAPVVAPTVRPRTQQTPAPSPPPTPPTATRDSVRDAAPMTSADSTIKPSSPTIPDSPQDPLSSVSTGPTGTSLPPPAPSL